MLVCDIMVLSNPPPGYEVPDSAFNASTVNPHFNCQALYARWLDGARTGYEQAWCAGKYHDCGDSKSLIWKYMVILVNYNSNHACFQLHK